MSDDETKQVKYLTHQYPIWRDQADYLLMADVEGDMEQLWARKLTETTFMICCIPFFIYDVALGDTVEAIDDQVTRVVERSGRYVFRIMFANESLHEMIRVVQGLASRGAQVERSSLHMLAIDAPNAVIATDIRSWLEELHSAGLLEYETGWL